MTFSTSAGSERRKWLLTVCAAVGAPGGCGLLDETFWCWSKRKFLVIAVTAVARLLDPAISLPASLIPARCRTRISRVSMTSSVSAVPPLRNRGSPQSACAHRTPNMFRIASRRCDTRPSLRNAARGNYVFVCRMRGNAHLHARLHSGPPARASSENVRRSASKLAS